MTATMEECKSTSLYYRQGSSDKEYHARLEAQGDGFVVNTAFGRRGSTLSTGTKTSAPVYYDMALMIFEKLVNEKKAKGYTEGANGTPYQHTGNDARVSGLLPQLLNAIDEAEAARLVSDPRWAMQEKKDGKRLLLRKEDGVVTGINKLGLTVGVCLPPELERELTVIEFQLPGKEELRPVLAGIIESAKLPGVAVEVREKAVEAASGLTTMEAENAFALSVAETSAISPAIIAREKAQAVKKNGLLEIIATRESLDSIGGLDVLKDWLLQRRHAFSQRARDYGLPSPKGLLILGLPGTGKSLTAKATAQVFNVPLLKLDAGRIFAGLVGQSESNLRSVIQTAEAIAPCVLWIDEVEKGFSGSKSSGSTDGGTSARVFGSLLSWLQEKTKPVFLVATANDVSQLPPELLRKGRFDEMFFVDLPNPQEREAIWRIVVAKHRRDAGDFDLAQLARASEGLTGSEIEQVFIEALYGAFDAEDEPNDLGIAGVLTEFVPLSKLMAEQITALRTWSKGRARPATSPAAPERRLRKLGV